MFKKNSLYITAIFMTLAMTSAFAAPYDVKSAGEVEAGKGTKTEAGYEGRAGAPIYEYGKGFQFGGLNIKPAAAYTFSWENNLFYSDGDRTSDTIHKVDLSATAELPINGGQHLLSGGYLAEIERFTSHDDQDHEDQAVQGALDLNFVPFSVNLRDTFRDTVSRSDTEFTERTSRYENQFNGLVEVPFAMFFLESEVDDFNMDYRTDAVNGLDHNILTLFQRAGYELGPSTQLLAEYGHGFIDYDNSLTERDGDFDQVMFGLRGSFTERLTYQVWGGGQFRIYDDATRPDFHGAVARGAIQFDLDEKSFVLLRASRSPSESTFDDQSFYVRNRADVSLRRQVAERLFLQGRGLVDYNEYSRISIRNGDEQTRRDWSWQTSAGLEYYMPNELVSMFLEYRFNARDSNTFALDYDAQTVAAGIKGNF